ncbi:hypothetical protein DXG01_009493, partial [Tephrocybe rancida]
MSNLGLFRLPDLQEWNPVNIPSPSSAEHLELCLDLFRLLQPVLNASVHTLAPKHLNDPAFDRIRRELGTHFLAAHLRVLHIIDTLNSLTCDHCHGPAHTHGEACFACPPSPQPVPGVPPLPRVSYLPDAQMADPYVVFNPDGTLALPPSRTPTPDAVHTTAM